MLAFKQVGRRYIIYVEAQAAFRKYIALYIYIFILNSLITHSINNNERLYCAFIDFTKAFDFAVRDILWYKLVKFGVRGKMFDIIKSIYTSVKSKVKQNNCVGESWSRARLVFIPVLFSMYLNDLEEELINK